MRVLAREEVKKERTKVVRALRSCLFIYPTDTIYGLGCNAEDNKLVRKLRSAKEQFSRPMSVIAPGMDWIRKNCKLSEKDEEWLEKLPGPYTFILELKNKKCISRHVNLGKDTIGVRIPDHWFTYVVSDMGVPVITTSANLTGENFMKSLDSLHPKLEKAVDYAVYEGEMEGKPSTIVDLTSKEAKVLRE